MRLWGGTPAGTKGILQWSQDASLFKVIPIGERIRIRFNADFLNVFNHPGNPNSVTADGMESTRSSAIRHELCN